LCVLKSFAGDVEGAGFLAEVCLVFDVLDCFFYLVESYFVVRFEQECVWGFLAFAPLGAPLCGWGVLDDCYSASAR